MQFETFTSETLLILGSLVVVVSWDWILLLDMGVSVGLGFRIGSEGTIGTEWIASVITI